MAAGAAERESSAPLARQLSREERSKKELAQQLTAAEEAETTTVERELERTRSQVMALGGSRAVPSIAAVCVAGVVGPDDLLQQQMCHFMMSPYAVAAASDFAASQQQPPQAVFRVRCTTVSGCTWELQCSYGSFVRLRGELAAAGVGSASSPPYPRSRRRGGCVAGIACPERIVSAAPSTSLHFTHRATDVSPNAARSLRACLPGAGTAPLDEEEQLELLEHWLPRVARSDDPRAAPALRTFLQLSYLGASDTSTGDTGAARGAIGAGALSAVKLRAAQWRLAWAMLSHPRLGDDSPLGDIDHDVHVRIGMGCVDACVACCVPCVRGCVPCRQAARDARYGGMFRVQPALVFDQASTGRVQLYHLRVISLAISELWVD
eukprot:COSAG01_NODE_175_length_22996_cov_18.857892_15_plen_379_part_00